MKTRMKRRRRLAEPIPTVATRVDRSTAGRAANHGLVNGVVSRYRDTGVGGVRRSFGAVLLLVGLMSSAVLPAATTQAQAPVPPGGPPRWSADFVDAPPPIPDMPTAGDAPPAEATTDPITPDAVCGDWHLQGRYGDRWPAASTWWEYQCIFRVDESYWPPDICWGSLCEPSTCWGYPHNCYVLFEQRTDHFVWDGAGVVFYGQAYQIAVENGGGPSFSDALFWDGPTARWYSLVPRHVLTVSKTGVGSGVVTGSRVGSTVGTPVERATPPAPKSSSESSPTPPSPSPDGRQTARAASTTAGSGSTGTGQ